MVLGLLGKGKIQKNSRTYLMYKFDLNTAK